MPKRASRCATRPRAALGLLAVLLLAPRGAHAYELLGAIWQNAANPGVPYCPVINARNANTDAKRAQFMNAVVAAAEAWSNDPNLGVACSALNVFDATGTSTCTGTPSQGSNKPWVYWVENWASVDGVGPSTIGVTPWVSQGARIVRAKILFNDTNYTWTTSTANIQTDVQSIATHEFGHFFGLDHYDEYSQVKRNQCSTSATYPSAMCAFYSGGLVRQLTNDDIQGICYLYPDVGEVGASCNDHDDCNSDVCHPDGYCTETCGTCDPGYSCVSGLCQRDPPMANCDICPGISCGANAMCVGGPAGAMCTVTCSAANPCPLGYACAPLEDGGSICYPWGATCNPAAPEPGEACDRSTCAVGSLCLDDGTSNGTCYAICNDRNDCQAGESCVRLDDELGYCDAEAECAPCGTLACGDEPVCLAVGNGSMCAPLCSDHTDCPKEFFCATLQGGGGACYPLAETCSTSGPGPGQACNNGTCQFGSVCLGQTCYLACRTNSDCGAGGTCLPTTATGIGYCSTSGGSSCACDTSSACQAGCTCDPDCEGAPTGDICACDVDTACTEGCACDPECEVCACDVTTACDAGCEACDPECAQGCSCGPRSKAGPESLLGMALALVLMAAQGRLRRRRA